MVESDQIVDPVKVIVSTGRGTDGVVTVGQLALQVRGGVGVGLGPVTTRASCRQWRIIRVLPLDQISSVPTLPIYVVWVPHTRAVAPGQGDCISFETGRVWTRHVWKN